MRSVDIRDAFVRHFVERGHTNVPSASLIADDPTLLLVGAGMVPFKPYFLGERPPPYPRAVSVQKCVRTTDIENVGQTTRHCTFFQMCGNFSFGDYFKEGAIPYAWELLTGPYGMAEDRLWVTVYDDDDEAADIWHRVVGVPEGRIQRRGKADNYWSMGVPGPCGPCSEIYYDRGPAYGRDGGPVSDEDRFTEVWNLVFMQYERGPGEGLDYDVTGNLPKPSIDTGLGLERMATVLQGVENIYEIDLVRPILDRASELTGARYGADHATDVTLRVVAEHTRTAAMLVADGVVPGNEGRGYVLRRMLRRVVQKAGSLGADGPVMRELFAAAQGALAPSFPELVSDETRIATVLVSEEEAFAHTLRAGSAIFDIAVGQARKAKATTLPGERAFALHDTYGFPIDLTLEMAADAGLSVDQAEFTRLMAEQRSRAKADAVAKKTGHADVSDYRALFDAAGVTEFTGYTGLSAEATVRGLLGSSGLVEAAGEGAEVELVTERTPFYGEAGGQVGDTGRIVVDGAQCDVLDTQRPLPDLVVHRVRVVSGEVRVGAAASLEVDPERRAAVSRAHTATHLVHQAFRRALGEQAAQAGSFNAPGRLRFDFGSPTAVAPGVLADVEDEVNAVLSADHPVRWFTTTLDDARAMGAVALFGEKYGALVRVVEVGDYARELCGGTHVDRSGQLGLVKILGEASIGAGVRRVEALVGLDAYRYLAREHVVVHRLAELLKVPSADLPDRVAALAERVRAAEKDLDKLRAGAVLAAAPALAAQAVDVNGVAVVAHEAPDGTSADDVRALALEVRGRLEPARAAVVAIAARGEGKASLVVAVGAGAKHRGVRAGALVKAIAPRLGGGGGGSDDLAQAGGGRPDGVPDALAALAAEVAAALGAPS